MQQHSLLDEVKSHHKYDASGFCGLSFSRKEITFYVITIIVP